MPLYLYKCTDCGEDFELLRSMSALNDQAPCPACGSAHTRKAFGNVYAYVGGDGGARRAVAGSSGCGSCSPSSASACSGCQPG